MFKPRHGYRSPITHRYRGKAKGCPIFSKQDEVTSDMVEDHDECLECLAKLKNRIDIYRNLADYNKPSNAVIKSLQKLSSSSSDNRLKTCLQFLIIKVNESNGNGKSNSIAIGHSMRSRLAQATTELDHPSSHQLAEGVCTSLRLRSRSESESLLRSQITRRYNHRNKIQQKIQQSCNSTKTYNDEPRAMKVVINEQQNPTHAQVSSSQDKVVNCSDHDEFDGYKQEDWRLHSAFINSSQGVDVSNGCISSNVIINNNNIYDHRNDKNGDGYTDSGDYGFASVNSHYYYECHTKNLHRTHSVARRLKDCSTSTDNIAYIKLPIAAAPTSDLVIATKLHNNNLDIDNTSTTDEKHIQLVDARFAFGRQTPLGAFGPLRSKERKESRENSDNDEDMDESNTSSSSSNLTANSSSSSSSRSTSVSCSCSSSNLSQCSHESCNAKLTNNLKFHLRSNGDKISNGDDVITQEGNFREPKLRLNEEKLQNIKAKPIQFKRTREGNRHNKSERFSKKKQAMISGSDSHFERNLKSRDDYAMPISVPKQDNVKGFAVVVDSVSHLFRERPKFYINKQLTKFTGMLDTKPMAFNTTSADTVKHKTAIGRSPRSTQLIALSSSPSPSLNGITHNINITNSNGVDICDEPINMNGESSSSSLLLECAICGIRQKATNVSYDHGLVSCPICARYFESFLRKPKELFCAQDGNCLMTFDSRCQACWIKLCLQKFNLAKERRDKLNLARFSPKLLSAPKLSIL